MPVFHHRTRSVASWFALGAVGGSVIAASSASASAFSENVSAAICQPANPARAHAYKGMFTNLYSSTSHASVVCPIPHHTGLLAEPGSGSNKIKTIKVSGIDGSNNSGASGEVRIKVCAFFAASITGGACGLPKKSTNVPPASGWYNLKVDDMSALGAGETPYLWIELPKPDFDHSGDVTSSIAGLYFDTI